jgi:uncharacterized coiled-coil DUF342 family protein
MMSETPSTTELWEKLRQRCKGEPTLLAQFDSLRTHMEQARLREALLRNRIRQDEVRYFNLHQKLIKAEKALDDARRDYDEDTHDLKDRLAKAEQENRQWREMTDPPYDAPYIESQRARIEQLEQKLDEARLLVKKYITKHDAAIDELWKVRKERDEARASAVYKCGYCGAETTRVTLDQESKVST